MSRRTNTLSPETNTKNNLREYLNAYIEEALTTTREGRDLKAYPEDRIDKYIENNSDEIEKTIDDTYEYFAEEDDLDSLELGKSKLAKEMAIEFLYDNLDDLNIRETDDQVESDVEYSQEEEEEEESSSYSPPSRSNTVTVNRRVEAPRAVEPPRRVEAPRRAEPSRRVEASRAVESTRRAEPSRRVEPPRAVETPRAVESTRRVEPPRAAESTRRVEPSRRAEPPRAVEPTRRGVREVESTSARTAGHDNRLDDLEREINLVNKSLQELRGAARRCRENIFIDLENEEKKYNRLVNERDELLRSSSSRRGVETNKTEQDKKQIFDNFTKIAKSRITEDLTTLREEGGFKLPTEQELSDYIEREGPNIQRAIQDLYSQYEREGHLNLLLESRVDKVDQQTEDDFNDYLGKYLSDFEALTKGADFSIIRPLPPIRRSSPPTVRVLLPRRTSPTRRGSPPPTRRGSPPPTRRTSPPPTRRGSPPPTRRR